MPHDNAGVQQELTQHQKDMKKITDDFETELRSIFGKNAWIAYGEGKDKPNLLGDTLTKDMLMALLAPIRGLFIGLVMALQGILTVLSGLEPSEHSTDRFQEGGASLIAGFSLILTVIISPVARLYNACTRKLAPYFSKNDAPLIETQGMPVQETGDIITTAVQIFKAITAQEKMKDTLEQGRQGPAEDLDQQDVNHSTVYNGSNKQH